jgi:hypothetical protein
MSFMSFAMDLPDGRPNSIWCVAGTNPISSAYTTMPSFANPTSSSSRRLRPDFRRGNVFLPSSRLTRPAPPVTKPAVRCLMRIIESKRVDEFANMSDEELRQYLYRNKE